MNIIERNKIITRHELRKISKGIELQRSNDGHYSLNPPKDVKLKGASLLYRWSVESDEGTKYLIGHTTNFSGRLTEYIGKINNPKNKSQFHRDVREFYENTKVEVIRLVDSYEDVGRAEMDEIAKYSKEKLYNQTKGGNGPTKMGKEPVSPSLFNEVMTPQKDYSISLRRKGKKIGIETTPSLKAASGIYRFLHLVTGERFVGASCNAARRAIEYGSYATAVLKGKPAKCDLAKRLAHSPQNWVFGLVAEVSPQRLGPAESLLIQKLKEEGHDLLNKNGGGGGGGPRKVQEASKALQRVARNLSIEF